MEKFKGQPWTFDALNEWLFKPSAYAPGTRMSYAGITNDKQRADVIAYLRSLSDNPVPLPPPEEAQKAAAPAAGAAPAAAAPAKGAAPAAPAKAAAAPATPAPAAPGAATPAAPAAPAKP
jgi:cytochrome c